MAPQNSLVPGMMLGGRYVVGALVHMGTTAEVWEGSDVRLDRPVTIKTLTPGASENQDAIDQFLLEAQAAARVHHPGIVEIYDTVETRGRPAIIMEHIEGRSLRDVLDAHGPVTLRDALKIAGDLCGALSALHGAHIVHCDLKPSNILIGRRKRVVLADFGSAFETDRRATAKRARSGTLQYAAPELLTTKPIDKRADLYSLGTLLFELVAGRRPFEERTDRLSGLARLNRKPADLATLAPHLPAPFTAAIMRCLERDPNDRFNHVDELAAALEASNATRSESSKPQPSPRPRSATSGGTPSSGTPSASAAASESAANQVAVPKGLADDSRAKADRPPTNQATSNQPDPQPAPQATRAAAAGTSATEPPIPGAPRRSTGPRQPQQAGNPKHPAERTSQPGIAEQELAVESGDSYPEHHHQERAGLLSPNVVMALAAAVILIAAVAWFGFGGGSDNVDIGVAVSAEPAEVAGLTVAATPVPTIETEPMETPTSVPIQVAEVDPTAIPAAVLVSASPSISTVGSFDPFGDGSEHDDQLSAITDADNLTTWGSELYRYAEFGGLKEGVGLRVELAELSSIAKLRVHSPYRSWTATVHVGATAHEELVEWGEPLAQLAPTESGWHSVSLPPDTTGRYVLIWFTRLPNALASAPVFDGDAAYQIEIANIEVLGPVG